MDMDMYGKFHIHGKLSYSCVRGRCIMTSFSCGSFLTLSFFFLGPFSSSHSIRNLLLIRVHLTLT